MARAPQAAALALACLISSAPLTEPFSVSPISPRTLHASALSVACRRTPASFSRRVVRRGRSKMCAAPAVEAVGAPAVEAVDEAVNDPFERVRAEMPPESFKLLVDNVAPSEVDGTDLILSSIDGALRFAMALEGFGRKGAVKTLPCLTAEECGSLRDYVDGFASTQDRCHGENAGGNTKWITRADSVDKCPDYQINLLPSDVKRIVGEAGFKRLWSIPLALKGWEECSEDIEPHVHDYKRVGVFLRKYTRDTRPFIPFHLDENSCTGNVALNGDSDYEGGSLLVVEGGKVAAAERREGDATVHDNLVAHGVSSMIGDGTRYSMIIFFEFEAQGKA